MKRWNNPDILILGSSFLNYPHDLGCLKKLEETNYLSGIKVIGATGSGIILGILMATGMKLDNIIRSLKGEEGQEDEVVIEGLGDKLDKMLTSGSDTIEEATDDLVDTMAEYLKDLYGMIPTLNMFFLFTGIDMLFSVYNVTEGKVEQLSRLNNPSFLVTDVIMASLSNLKAQHVEIGENEFSDPSLACPLIKSFKGKKVISVITVPSVQEDIVSKLSPDMSASTLFDILCMCSSLILTSSRRIARIEGYDYLYLRSVYEKNNLVPKELKEIMEMKGYEQMEKMLEPPVQIPRLHVSHNGLHDMMIEGFSGIIDRFHEDYTDLSDKWPHALHS